MTTKTSRLSTRIDFDRDGKQCDFVRLPHSVHRSAYGWLPIPLVCLKNGPGPTVLLMSGNHGDEYEGQVALTKLVKVLDPETIRGRVLILPMANYPAAKAGMRTSPIDDANLNRVFPGDPDGTVTHQIAYYIEHVLMAMSDYMIDLHSGGSSLTYLPSVIMGGDPSDETFAAKLGMMRAFGAPYAFIFPGGHSSGVSAAAAARQGVVALGTELAGAGTVSPEALAICERGLRNMLRHLGVLVDAPEEATPDTRLLRAPDMRSFSYAPEDGLFEPVVDLGDEVAVGDLAGLVHSPETPWREPVEVHFEAPGLVVCKRIPGRVERGDCVYHLGEDYTL
ncbi:MAG: succinylglutamate desuccinylase/aspartoacylase family protein [Ectothiorhodospiraceae bacterium]|nr:succinylglutamate desuccinylase/aspartoacylase family protein [Ectothiorhodospiraceae bacterium]